MGMFVRSISTFIFVALATVNLVQTAAARRFPVVEVPLEYTYLLPEGFKGSLKGSFVGDTKTPNSSINALLERASKTPFVSYTDEFTALLPKKPALELVASKPGVQFSHEGGIWIPSINEVWMFSKPQQPPAYITVLNLSTMKLSRLKTDPPLLNANGGYYYDGTVYIGSFRDNTTLRGSLTAVDPFTRIAKTLTNSYFGLQYNAVDDVVVVARGKKRALFFTDLCFIQTTGNYTHLSGCQLPNAVWRYDLDDGNITPVISQTDIANPNGIRVSPDQSTLYITDSTPSKYAFGSFDKPWGTPAIYQYHLDAHLFPVNRRLLGIVRQGIADGMHVDDAGRIWTAEFEGIVVRSAVGKVLGLFNALEYIESPTTVPIANFALAGDVLFLFAVDKLYKVKLAQVVVSRRSPIVN